MGLFSILDVKDSSNTLHAPMAEIELKETDQSVPYILLCDKEPEPMSHEAAKLSRNRKVWERAVSTELEGLRTSNAFATAEEPAHHKAIGAKWLFKQKTNQAGYVSENQD